MIGVFAIIFLLGMIGIILGMLKPSLILRKNPSRKKLVKVYGALIVASFIGMIVTAPPPQSQQTQSTNQIKEETKTEEPTEAKESTKVVSVSVDKSSNTEVSTKPEEKQIDKEHRTAQEPQAELVKKSKADLEKKERLPSAKTPQKASEVSTNSREPFQVGYTTYTIARSWWSSRLSKNEFLDQKPDAMFLFVELSVKNTDTKPRSIPPFKLIDENGSEYESSSKAMFVEKNINLLDSLNPNVTKSGVVVFDVPKDHQYKIVLSGGYWSTDKTMIPLEPKK
ncbi:MAG: DUF4352 domain-containing protein [Deltaproteobacteria bacterium]|nr:DUF4352 domain-containing protein [Deltaproteobacteria bacterium]